MCLSGEKKYLLHLIENTFDRKRIYANPSSYPNPISNPNTNSNPNPKAQLRFWIDEMTSFFDQVYRYQNFHFRSKVFKSNDQRRSNLIVAIVEKWNVFCFFAKMHLRF